MPSAGIIASRKRNTSTLGKQVFWLVGDSIARGTSSGEGPTPTAGTVQEYNGTSIVDVSNDDLIDALTGSYAPKLGIDYNASTGKIPVFCNSGSGGAEFYPNGDNNNWYTSGTLYAAAKTKVKGALAAAGVNQIAGIILILGVNDARGAQVLADVQTGIDSLFTRLLTDYPSVPIYVVSVGRTDTVSYNSRTHYIKKALRQKSESYGNVHLAANLLSFYAWGYYGADNLHLAQSGNDVLGAMLARYITSTETNKEVRQVLGCFEDAVTGTKATAIKTFVETMQSNSMWDLLESLQVYRGASRHNVLSDWRLLTAPLDSTFTFTADDKISSNGSSTYLRTSFVPANLNILSAQTDFITGIKTGTVTTGAGTAGVGFGATDGTALIRAGQNTSSQIFYSANDATASTYATDTKLANNSYYSVARDGTTKYLNKGGTDVASPTVSSTGNLSKDPYVGAYNNNGSAATFINAEFYCFFFAKRTGWNQSTFITAMDTLLTALA